MSKRVNFEQNVWVVSDALRGAWASRGGRPAFDYADYFAVYAIYLMRNRENLDAPVLLGPDQDVVLESLGKPSAVFARNVIEEELSYTSVRNEADVADAVVEAACVAEPFVSDDLVRSYLAYASAFKGAGRGNMPTSESLARLALRVLDVSPDESVADLGCGEGGFIVQALEKEPHARYTGVEIDNLQSLIASIRFSVIEESVTIEPTCAFDLKATEDVSFDKVFANYPLGIRFRNMDWFNDGYEIYEDRLSRFGEPASADWIFGWNALDFMKEDGRAVTFMSCGSACNRREAEIRREFVESGFVECVVALPEKMHEGTNAASLMLVLSRGNEGVRFVDAAQAFQPGRRRNTFSSEDIEAIARACAGESDMSIFATVEDIRRKGWDLMPESYMKEDIVFENGVTIAELTKYLGRGSTADASSLDEKASTEESPFKYVRLQDLSDGSISGTLPSLVEMPTKLRPAFLENGDVLVSRSAAPVKVAYAEVEDGKTIVAVGNLYILRFDETKVNPLYAAAFLYGETGSELVYRACQKTGIPSLPMDKLKGISIPLPPRAEQDEIAARFKNKLDEVSRAKEALEQLRKELVRVSE